MPSSKSSGKNVTIPDEYLGNFNAATKDLNLTPQEQGMYQRHLNNLLGPGGVNNEDGSRSTLFQMSFEHENGKTYNIPTVYEGKILDPRKDHGDAAIERAKQEGLENTFPSYNSPEEAESRYTAMHDYMEKDTSQWLQQNSDQP